MTFNKFKSEISSITGTSTVLPAFYTHIWNHLNSQLYTLRFGVPTIGTKVKILKNIQNLCPGFTTNNIQHFSMD